MRSPANALSGMAAPSRLPVTVDRVTLGAPPRALTCGVPATCRCLGAYGRTSGREGPSNVTVNVKPLLVIHTACWTKVAFS